MKEELKAAIKGACGTHRQIAEAYGVTMSQVGHIRSDKKKKYVKEPRDFAGSGNGMAKLTDLQVLAIAEELKEGVKGKYLAKKYGVSPSTISHIKHKKAWMDTLWVDGEWRPDGRQY